MKTKYVCHGLFSLYVNFHNNRTMWSTNLLVKIFRWGGGKDKEPLFRINLTIRRSGFRITFFITQGQGHIYGFLSGLGGGGGFPSNPFWREVEVIPPIFSLVQGLMCNFW